jgi:hypothetical protein
VDRELYVTGRDGPTSSKPGAASGGGGCAPPVKTPRIFQVHLDDMTGVTSMSQRRQIFTEVAGMAIGLAALSVACSDLTKPKFDPIEVEGEEVCEASADWLPNTPELPQFLPVPHPAGECPFYRSGWQNFLRAMQPGANGVPAIVGYPTIDDVFQPAKGPHPANRSYLGDVKQAGGRQILIDGNGNSLYYGIHVNDAFAKFITDNGLQTAAGLQAYPSDPIKKGLLFPPGVVEFKSAWQVVEGTPDQMAAMMKDYITMQTTVPTLTQDGPPNYTIHENRNMPRTVTVRLLAIHVVSTLVGHPEFIWARFEHSTGMANAMPDTAATDMQRDVAPILDGDVNPDPADATNSMVTKPASMDSHVLYAGGTPANKSNQPFMESQLRLVNQKFMRADNGMPAQTSIYRMFPASKSNTTDPDAAITSLNHNVEVLFKDHPTDVRGNYRLLGAQWMDKPGYYANNIPIQNDETNPMANPSPRPDGRHVAQDGQLAPPISKQELIDAIKADGSDSEFSILAGEDRMSSTAMESFTQAPGSFNNCFTCHNTQAITANGIPTDRDTGAGVVKLLDPGLLNVSHVLSQFLLEEHEAGLTP